MTPRKVLRIARWELTRNARGLDRRTAAVIGVVLLAAVTLGPAVADRGLTVDNDIYRVGVAEDSPYYGAVSENPTFAVARPDVAALDDGTLDMVIRERSILVSDSPKGRAALAELRQAVSDYNNRLMAAEDDESAAFPVSVTVVYAEQQRSYAGTGAAGGTSSGDGTATGGGTGGTDGGDGDGASDSPDSGTSGGSGFAPPAIGDVQSEGGTGTPGDITPPFPFESLVLAFAFILPMNFVIQAYASSVIGERINRRGELLLVSPVSRGDIIAGKTLPYFLAMLAISSVTALAIGGGVVAIAAVIPIALVFLASGFVGAMFARSFKELTFVTVSVSVALTSYVFVPAVFTDVHPIALISPLTLVVSELGGDAVTLGEYVFSTGPFYLMGGVLFALGAGVYREEDMFTQRSLGGKVVDALDSQLTGRWSVAKLSVLLIPFVFVAELLAIAVLFVFPASLSIPVLFGIIAVVEEAAKSVAIYAGFARATFDRTLGTAAILGALSGLGFFVGEKVTLLAQLVGLPELALGEAAFGTVVGTSPSPLVLLGLFVAPLVLHTVTATVSALGARGGNVPYLVGFALAVLIHVAYNATVVSTLA